MVFTRAFFLAAALVAMPLAFQAELAGTGPIALTMAEAQQMGNDPWNYSRGSRGFWANYQAVKKSQESSAGAGGGGTGAEVMYYYSSSTAIANQQIINQELGDNTTGIIDANANQMANGNQTAEVQSTTNHNPAEFTDNSTNTVNYPGAN